MRRMDATQKWILGVGGVVLAAVIGVKLSKRDPDRCSKCKVWVNIKGAQGIQRGAASDRRAVGPTSRRTDEP